MRSEEELYADEWLDIRLADVELPDGKHLSHRLIRTAAGAGTVIGNDRGEVLLLWRHRFITDAWAWEIPIGMIEPGEDPAQAAAREAEEETGWRPVGLRPLLALQPSAGISDSVHHVFFAPQAVHIGEPTDPYEAERIEWVPLADIPKLISLGEIVSSTTVSALLYASASTSGTGMAG